MSEPLIVTVDGGGTQCRAAIFEADGRRLGHAAGAFANLVTDFEDSRRHITEAIDAAYRDAGIADMSERSDIAVLGIAGAEIGDLSTRLGSALDFATLRVMSDRDIAVAGILGDRNGTLAQIGTGSFFARQHDGRLSYAGGWGLTLGDECGGAWLGRELLRAVLMAHDGLLEGSPLGAQVTSNFGNGPDGIVMFAATATPADFAELAPVLFEAHESGDSLANHVLTRAVADLELGDPPARLVLDCRALRGPLQTEPRRAGGHALVKAQRAHLHGGACLVGADERKTARPRHASGTTTSTLAAVESISSSHTPP